ncbi:TIGR03756 family integrating conjugative element protein [Xanthomonas campestris pv. zinniae]|nr:TIGR03756 family integrating conjugative element protein [Xanthomonas campestris pv. zinniae]
MMRSRRFRAVVVGALLASTGSSFALNTATIVASALSPDCLAYRVVGVCYWLYCTWSGCTVRTSIKVQHYIPDAVVSSYSNTGENPWVEVRAMSQPNPTAQAGGDGTTNEDHENNLAKFKNADVIGHPAGAAFSEFASQFGYTCEGAGTPFVPYLLSTFDTLAWRYNVPEMAYPEALTPGMREIGSRSTADLWGNVYPRGGFLHQSDDHLAGAVVAQRAGDVVTRKGQPHVYQPLLATAHAGYWPAGALVESYAATGRWQELTPTLSSGCAVFPNKNPHVQAQRGDYAWALWRPYSCCQRRGQVFLGSVDFF